MSPVAALLQHKSKPAFLRLWRKQFLHLPLAISAIVATTLAFGMATGNDWLVSRLLGDRNPPFIMLLGEVHDNQTQHTIQLKTLEMLLDTDVRPALMLEQINRERQPEIDHLIASGQATADKISRIAQQGPDAGNWDWDHYRPLVELALQHNLPIVAANLSRNETRRIALEGLANHGFDARVPEDILSQQARQMVDSHCGMIGEPAGRAMATAQIARDQYMASLIGRHAARGVVLIAGNGHVRRDIGIPRWLPAELSARAVSIGLVEDEVHSSTAFDRTLSTPPQPRADPCDSLHKGIGDHKRATTDTQQI